MLNKGAFAFKIVRGALKWLLKAGSRLIEVATTAGLTVYQYDSSIFKFDLKNKHFAKLVVAHL